MCWDVLARVSGAHFNWIVLISQPLTVLIIQMVRVVDVDYITLNHAVAVLCFCSLLWRKEVNTLYIVQVDFQLIGSQLVVVVWMPDISLTLRGTLGLLRKPFLSFFR